MTLLLLSARQPGVFLTWAWNLPFMRPVLPVDHMAHARAGPAEDGLHPRAPWPSTDKIGLSVKRDGVAPLYHLLEEYVAERLPGARLLPIVGAGFPGSHWVRTELGTVAYGFAPVLFGDGRAYRSAPRGADERIEVADLAEMTEFHLRVLKAQYALGLR